MQELNEIIKLWVLISLSPLLYQTIIIAHVKPVLILGYKKKKSLSPLTGLRNVKVEEGDEQPYGTKWFLDCGFSSTRLAWGFLAQMDQSFPPYFT